MSVYKRKGSTTFQYDFKWKGSRFHGSTGQKTKRAAEQVESKIRAEIALHSQQTKKPLILIKTAAELYAQKLQVENKYTQDNFRWIMNLVDHLGPNRYISDVQHHEFENYAALRGGKVAASSVNREIDVWRAMWRRTAKGYEIGDMPDWGALRYAVKAHDPAELADDAQERLFEAMREDFRPLFKFLLLSGWRVSEGRLLRWSDLDFPNMVARAKIKGGNIISRPLTSQIIALIADQPRIGPFVFTYECRLDHKTRRKGDRYPFSQYGWRKR